MTGSSPEGWELTIDGHPAALAWLERKTVTVSPRVVRVGNAHRLHWDELSAFEYWQNEKVSLLAERHLRTLSGLASLFVGLHADLRLIDQSYRRADGGRNVIVTVHDTIRVSATVEAELTVRGPNGELKHVTEDNRIPQVLALVEVDEAMNKVLRLADADLQDWNDLYRLFEVLEDAAGGTDALCAMSGISKNKVSLFTRTANSPDLIGDEARHGVQAGSAPTKAMSKDDAIQMLRQLARAWITWRAS